MASQKDKTNPNFNDTQRGDLFRIDPRNIVVETGFNVRQDFGDLDELAASIAENGVLNPITVVAEPNADGTIVYRLVDGERRYRATMLAIERGADISRIPATKTTRSKKTEELYIEQVLKNEGKPFNDYEMGLMFKRFIDMGYCQGEIAPKFHKQQSYVSACLRLLELPREIQEKLATNQISSVAVQNIMSATEDEGKAVEVVQAAVETAQNKGKTRATVKDVNDETVKAKNEAKTVIKGLTILTEAMEKAGIDPKKTVVFTEILIFLMEGKTIEETLNLPIVKSYLTLATAA